jgi:LPXTG-motif cell wall-anchored protein
MAMTDVRARALAAATLAGVLLQGGTALADITPAPTPSPAGGAPIVAPAPAAVQPPPQAVPTPFIKGVPTPSDLFSKTASRSKAKAGDRITYKIQVLNYLPTARSYTVLDDLRGVLDDAQYNGDARASKGRVRYTGGVLTWSGTVRSGRATITYSVTVRSARFGGNGMLDNAIVSNRGNCLPGSQDKSCRVRVVRTGRGGSGGRGHRPWPWNGNGYGYGGGNYGYIVPPPPVHWIPPHPAPYGHWYAPAGHVVHVPHGGPVHKGALPYTGSPTSALAALGGLLLVGGAGAVVAARRRRPGIGSAE